MKFERSPIPQQKKVGENKIKADQNINNVEVPRGAEAKEFTEENIEEWKYDLISEKLKDEARDRLKKYKFGELNEFQNIDPAKLYSEIDPQQELALYSTSEKITDIPLTDIHSINDLIKAGGEEAVNRTVKRRLQARIERLEKIEKEYKALLEFFSDPSAQTLAKLKEDALSHHPNHEYGFKVSPDNTFTARAICKREVRMGIYLFSNFINDDIIDASAEYQEFKCPTNWKGNKPLFARMDRWNKGFIFYVMDTYETILNGWKDYFVSLTK